MLRLIGFALLTGLAVAERYLPCVVCIYGGSPTKPNAIVPGTSLSCQYINDNVFYLSQPCYLAQDDANQVLCGCPGTAPAASPNTRVDPTPGVVVPVPPTPSPLRRTPSPTRAPTKAPTRKAPTKPPTKPPTPSPTVRRGTPAPTGRTRHYVFVPPTRAPKWTLLKIRCDA